MEIENNISCIYRKCKKCGERESIKDRRLCSICRNKQQQQYYEEKKDVYKTKYYHYEKRNRPVGRPKKEVKVKKNYYELKKEFVRLCNITL